MAHKWAGWLIRSGPQVGRLATKPLPRGPVQLFRAGDEISTGPQVGWVATLPISQSIVTCSETPKEDERIPVVPLAPPSSWEGIGVL